MAVVPFVKVQGLGNDFLVVDLRPGKPAASVTPSPTDPAIVRALCDRNFGVGADGVLAIVAGDSGDARMRVINADGTEPEMCGNGIRCVAKVLYETDASLRRPVVRIDTGAGLLACAIDAVDGQVRSVAVEMGRPRLTRGEIPVVGPPAERVIKAPILGRERAMFMFTGVSMGNPHAVIFVDDPAADLMALAKTYGPGLEVDPTFPRRTNVEFARVRKKNGTAPAEIDLVVWERGVGITLACGTGACATVVAACLEGRATAGEEIPVHLPGGTLAITVVPEKDSPGDAAAPAFAGVTMRGPAVTVFDVNVDLARLAAPENRR